MTGEHHWRQWVIPPALSAWAARRNRDSIEFDDSVGTWHSASAASSGYSTRTIVEQVCSATQSVIDGKVAFERDGVTFSSPEYRWPVLAALLNVAAREGELRVLDFGGSLGSTFWQHQKFLTDIGVKWGVVEQPDFVSAGKSLKQNSIEFFESIAECQRTIAPNVVLLSSVLQYLSEPDFTLSELLESSANTLIIDRTPMSDSDANIPCIQRVPAHIYRASYPAWIFSRQWLITQLKDWSIKANFEGIEPEGVTTSGLHFSWNGLIAERSSHA